MKKFILALILCLSVCNLLTTQCFAAWWNPTTNLQTLTVSAAFTQVQNCLLALGGDSPDPPTNIVAKNLKLNGATSGTVTITPAAVAGTTAITVPAVAGTLVTSAGTGADIDIGDYEMRAQTLEADVATGTAPLTIASTTKVTNLNADTVDGAGSKNSVDGIFMPSGALFYMITGNCPAGTTDVSSTYSNKFVKINSTAGTSGGVVLTGTSDSHTLTTTEIPAHTHTVGIWGQGALADSGNITGQATTNETQEATSSTGGGGGHTHTFSTATTLEPSSITAKACQVD